MSGTPEAPETFGYISFCRTRRSGVTHKLDLPSAAGSNGFQSNCYKAAQTAVEATKRLGGRQQRVQRHPDEKSNRYRAARVEAKVPDPQRGRSQRVQARGVQRPTGSQPVTGEEEIEEDVLKNLQNPHQQILWTRAEAACKAPSHRLIIPVSSGISGQPLLPKTLYLSAILDPCEHIMLLLDRLYLQPK